MPRETATAILRAVAQDMPGEYKTIRSTLGERGDFKDGVLKVTIQRHQALYHKWGQRTVLGVPVFCW